MGRTSRLYTSQKRSKRVHATSSRDGGADASMRTCVASGATKALESDVSETSAIFDGLGEDRCEVVLAIGAQ